MRGEVKGSMSKKDKEKRKEVCRRKVGGARV